MAPLGSGIVDQTAGSALVTAYFTGKELKNILEFLLVDNPAHPGEYFPRASGMKFKYDPSRSKFDVVTSIELGDFDHGYKTIDLSGEDQKLYSLTCPVYLGILIAAIPKYTKGLLAVLPKNALGRGLKSRVEAMYQPKDNVAEILAPPGILDENEIAVSGKTIYEIKEWQAIMDYMHKLPVKKGAKLPVIPVDARASEVRSILTGQTRN